jgi:hypothetical protein
MYLLKWLSLIQRNLNPNVIIPNLPISSFGSFEVSSDSFNLFIGQINLSLNLTLRNSLPVRTFLVLKVQFVKFGFKLQLVGRKFKVSVS